MLVGLFEQLEREGQKEVENPGKGGRVLKTKGIEDKVFFLLRVGEGLSSVFTKISEARGLWTYHLAYRKEGMAVWTAFSHSELNIFSPRRGLETAGTAD